MYRNIQSVFKFSLWNTYVCVLKNEMDLLLNNVHIGRPFHDFQATKCFKNDFLETALKTKAFFINNGA